MAYKPRQKSSVGGKVVGRFSGLTISRLEEIEEFYLAIDHDGCLITNSASFTTYTTMQDVLFAVKTGALKNEHDLFLEELTSKQIANDSIKESDCALWVGLVLESMMKKKMTLLFLYMRSIREREHKGPQIKHLLTTKTTNSDRTIEESLSLLRVDALSELNKPSIWGLKVLRNNELIIAQPAVTIKISDSSPNNRTLLGLKPVGSKEKKQIEYRRLEGLAHMLDKDSPEDIMNFISGNSKLSFPNGKVDMLEIPTKAASRELLEESGLMISDLSLNGVSLTYSKEYEDWNLCFLYEKEVKVQSMDDLYLKSSWNSDLKIGGMLNTRNVHLNWFFPSTRRFVYALTRAKKVIID